MAIPLEGEGWTASMDDARALVDAVHQRLQVTHPMDDYFLNLLGTARLAGRVAADLSHMRGRVVVLGAYKIRQPHVAALHHVARAAMARWRAWHRGPVSLARRGCATRETR